MKTSTTISLGAALLFNFAALSIRSHAAPGDVDFSFDPGSGVNGEVISIVVQPDGKALIAGQFTTVRGAVRKRIARLNADGSVDPTFSPTGSDFSINSVALQPDGKVLVGGVTGTARLSAVGAGDSSFNQGAVIRVNSIALQADGKILIGGRTSFLDQTGRIVRLNPDGSLDSDFGASVNAGTSEVFVVAPQPDGKIYVGGLFTSINGTPRNRIARLNADGSLDTSFDPGTGANNAVRSVAVQSDGKLVIGGNFGLVNSVTRTAVARLNANGTLDPTFTPGAFHGGSLVHSIAIQADGKMLVFGGFTSIAGVPRNCLARLNSNGSLDTVFNPGTDTNGWVRSVAVQTDGTMLIGGSFVSMAGTKRIRVARLNADGGLDSTFDPGTFVNDSVRGVSSLADGKALIAGFFTFINGAARNGIARLNEDGTSDNSFDPGAGANGRVYALAVQPDSKALIGGGFTSVAGTSRNGIARLNANGSLDTSFNPGSGADFEIFALASQPDGKVLIGGRFTTINGTTRNRIARLNANGSLDTTFNPGAGAANNVYSIAIQTDGKALIAGEFGSVNGTARNKIARLNVNGSLDTSFNPGSGATDGSSGFFTAIYSVAIQPDGKALVGGDFTSFNGTARNGIVRLNVNGSLDDSFNPGSGVNGGFYFPAVYSVMRQLDGKILIGGDFTSFDGISRSGIARLNMNGSLDASFYPGAGANNLVYSVATQPDGKVLIGGDFALVNNAARPGVARLHADYLPSRLNIVSAGEIPQLQLTGEIGQPYVLEYTSELSPGGSWTALPAFTLTNSPQTIITDASAPAPQRFYRARVP